VLLGHVGRKEKTLSHCEQKGKKERKEGRKRRSVSRLLVWVQIERFDFWFQRSGSLSFVCLPVC
jgi:hypothetical protein